MLPMMRLLSFLFLLRGTPPAVTEVWNVTVPESTHSVYLQNTNNCTADMAAVVSAAKVRLAGTQDTLILQFPAGTYTFPDDATGIYIDGATNGTLIVRGAGTNQTALCFNAVIRTGLWINNSKHVAIENLHLTRPGYYASQFDVVSVNTNGAYLQIHEGFPTPDELKAYGRWDAGEITLLPIRYVNGAPQQNPCDRKRQLPVIPGDPGFPLTDLGGGLWYAEFKPTDHVLPGWGAGDMVAFKIRTGQLTLRFDNSDDCIGRDLLITRAASSPIRTFRNTNRLLLERVHIARPIGGIGGRIPFFSGCDGGIQLVSGYEGPTVRDCIVESTADDAIALFSYVENTNLVSGALFEGNTIYDGQARGFNILPSRDVTIRSNTFYRGDWYSISIYQDNAITTLPTGSVTRCEIYGNVFINSLVDPVIGLDAVPGTPVIPHDQIYIHDNRFINAPKNNHMVYVNAAATVSISSNRIESFSTEEDKNTAQTGNALVYVKSGSAVTGRGNVFWETTSRVPWQKVLTNDTVDVEWIFEFTH